MTLSAEAAAPARFKLGGLTNRGLFGAAAALFLLSDGLVGLRLAPLTGGVVVTAALAALAVLLTDPVRRGDGVLSRPVRGGRLGACVALAVGILLLGGETHVFYATTDWLTRDAVLADMVRGRWALPTYRLGPDLYLMRAPLGMYLSPAMVGGYLGLRAAHLALLIQNAALLGVILYLLCELYAGWKGLAVILLFSGPCVIWRGLVLIATHRLDLALSDVGPLDSWNPYFEYSSPMTQFFWVPNHALPGWWIGLMLAMLQAGEIGMATLAVSVAGLAIWSPLAILPAAPLAIVAVLRNPRRHLANARVWVGVVVGLGFLPVAIYLTLASGTIAHDVLLLRPYFPFWYAVFILIQLPPVGFVIVQRRHLRPELRDLFWISAGFLMLLPLFKFGPGNDLVMRASIPPLLIVSICFAEALFRSSGLAAGVGWALAALGVCSPAVEIGRAVGAGAFPISRCTLMEASRQLGVVGAPPNYAVEARRVPAWLVKPVDRPQATGIKGCWPGRNPHYR